MYVCVYMVVAENLHHGSYGGFPWGQGSHNGWLEVSLRLVSTFRVRGPIKHAHGALYREYKLVPLWPLCGIHVFSSARCFKVLKVAHMVVLCAFGVLGVQQHYVFSMNQSFFWCSCHNSPAMYCQG